MKRIEPDEITAETTVAALLERWPHLTKGFQARRMLCPGCAMSRFDPLGYVADVYGLPADRWLRELRREVAPQASGRRLVRKVTRPKRRPSHATY